VYLCADSKRRNQPMFAPGDLAIYAETAWRREYMQMTTVPGRE
jgi:hypothetical protein